MISLLGPLSVAITLLLSKAKTRGIKATEIADYLEVKPYILTNWKTGRSKPNQEQIRKLSEWALKEGIELPSEWVGSSKNEETPDDRLNVMTTLFKSLHNPKSKDELINRAFELWRAESQLKE